MYLCTNYAIWYILIIHKSSIRSFLCKCRIGKKEKRFWMIISSKYEKEDLTRGPLFLSLFIYKFQILPINIPIDPSQQILIRILSFPADNSQVCEVQTEIPCRIGISFVCVDVFKLV